MASGKEIKTRIKSVKNTKKITKAMELISTVKMKKATDSALGARPFARKALEMICSFEQELSKSPFIHKENISQKKKKELVVIISSNKGLCGGYNVNLFREIAHYISEISHETGFITFGKKAKDFILRTWQNLEADFSDILFDTPNISSSSKVSQEIFKLFLNEWYTKISIFYMYYHSAINQQTVSETFLPIKTKELERFLESVLPKNTKKSTIDVSKIYLIEPNVTDIIDTIIPMVLKAKFHEMVLEAKASEHASRMIAMKNAKDNAGKKVDSLTLVYNKTRQAAITKEVSEIVSGVESLKEV